MSNLIVATEDKNKAPQASLRSPAFRRMLRLTWPHRRYLWLGFAASILHGFLHSVSVIGVLPVLKVMLSPDGLHGWVYRAVASERLEAKLDIRDIGGKSDEARTREMFVVRFHNKSGLLQHDVHETDGIRALGIAPPGAEASLPTEKVEPLKLLEDLAKAPAGSNVAFITSRAADSGGEPIRMQLRQAPFYWRMASRVVALLPRADTQDAMVRTLVVVLAVLIVVVIVSNIARFFGEYFVSIGVLRAVMDLRRLLYRKVLRLPMDFFTTEVSDTVSRFVQDTQEIQRGLLALFGKLLVEPIKATFLLASALILNARMTLTMLLIAPFAVIMFLVVGRKIRKANRRLLQIYGRMIGALTATLQAIGIVKAYNAENVERRRLWGVDRQMFKHQLRIAMLEAFLRPLLEVMAVFGVCGVAVWLGSKVIHQQIKLEEFAVLMFALGMLIDPLRKMADIYPRVTRSAAGATRIFAVVDSPAETELMSGAIELSPLREAIELRDVSYTYPNAAAPAINHLNLSIHRGETLALVGANGSGKTTLAKLLIRFHDPQQGTVLFDGVDIRNATLRSLRRQFSLVLQDAVVFPMTIADNIAYGTRRARREAIEAAARKAHADEFIRARTGGYEDVVGERGSTLSGGQRQRVCIARAVMRDAPILIFDEATSQIDSESEVQIQGAIREYAEGRTTILIAHRLSTIRFAKRVVVLAGGEVVDSGTHAELLTRCELYATLCRTQLVE